MDLISHTFTNADGCVHVAETPEGLRFTSTEPDNDASIVYTDGEFADYIELVKSGAADELYARACARAGRRVLVA
jgi:hypothetical protein